MANLVDYVKTVWENGKTALNAARMNNMEQGISNCASQINRLGDSVSQKVPLSSMSDGRLSFKWKFGTDIETGLSVKIDGTEVAFIGAGTHTKG